MKKSLALSTTLAVAYAIGCAPSETIPASPEITPSPRVVEEAPVAPGDGANDAGPSDAGPNDAGPAEPARFSAEPFPSEKSKAPSREEWKKAPVVSADRNTMHKRCKVFRVREWVRVECEGYFHSVSMIAGDHAEVDVGVIHDNSNVFLVFPIRKGQKRFFQVNSVSKWSWFPSFYVSEHWLSSEDTPFISILDA